MRIENSLNVTFDESLLGPKSPPLVEDDRIIESMVQNMIRSASLKANVSEPGYLKSLKEARGHPIEQVIGELNKRTLRQELLEYMVVHVNDAFESSKPSWGKMCTLIIGVGSVDVRCTHVKDDSLKG
nr:hypothetical protein [Tanacetum cinerariifolium]